MHTYSPERWSKSKESYLNKLKKSHWSKSALSLHQLCQGSGLRIMSEQVPVCMKCAYKTENSTAHHRTDGNLDSKGNEERAQCVCVLCTRFMWFSEYFLHMIVFRHALIYSLSFQSSWKSFIINRVQPPTHHLPQSSCREVEIHTHHQECLRCVAQTNRRRQTAFSWNLQSCPAPLTPTRWWTRWSATPGLDYIRFRVTQRKLF